MLKATVGSRAKRREGMSLRHKLTLGSLIAFSIFISIPIIHHRKEILDDIFLHLASETVGIMITVAIIDKLLDRERERRDGVSRHSCRFLCQIDHAVWVWQGGDRALNIDELLILLAQVDNSDPLPEFTERLFLRIAYEADETLKLMVMGDSSLISPDLQNGLEAMARVVMLHDQGELTPKHLAMEVEDAVQNFAKTITLSYPSIRKRPGKECSEDNQKRRFERWGSAI
jgi:hypothetical protein